MEIGSKVRLRNSKQMMVVEEVGQNSIKCIWHHQGILQERSFNPLLLELCEEEVVEEKPGPTGEKVWFRCRNPYAPCQSNESVLVENKNGMKAYQCVKCGFKTEVNTTKTINNLTDLL